MLNVYDIRIDQSGTNASSNILGNIVFDSSSAGRIVLETKNIKESPTRLYYTDARVHNQIVSYGTTAGFTSPITQGTNGLFHSGRTVGLGGALSRNTSINLNNKDFKLMRGVTNSVDFANTTLYSSGGGLSINYNTRRLYAKDQRTSIDWQNRQLRNSAGTVTFDWNTSPDNTYFKQNGNNFGTHGYVGTTNNAQLIFKTNNTNRWSILENGNLFANGDYSIQGTLNSSLKNILTINNSSNTITFGNTTTNVQAVGLTAIVSGATSIQIRNAAAANITAYIPSTGNWNFNGSVDTGYKVNITGGTRMQDVYFRRGTDYSSSGTFNNVPTTNTSNIRFTNNTAPTITGFGQGSDGKVLYVSNTGTGQLVIANNSASSIAANRILTGRGQNVTISSGAVVELIYDSTATVWRLNSGVINNDISLTGDVTGSGSAGIATTIATNAVTTTKINNSAVTYAKIQNITANRILGRITSTGAPQELAISSGLAFSGASITTDSSVVTLTGSQALTNKTITSGRFNQLLDTSGNISLLLSSVGSANYITVFNGGGGASPKLVSTGSDTNINLQLESKGPGTINFQIGSTYLMSLPTAAPSSNTVLQYNGSAYIWGSVATTLTGSTAINEASWSANTNYSKTLTVTGAAVNDRVVVTITSSLLETHRAAGGGITLEGYVNSSNTVTVWARVTQFLTVSGTWYVTVFK